MTVIRVAVGAGIAIALSPLLIWIVGRTAVTTLPRRRISALVATAAAIGACIAIWPPASVPTGVLLVLLGLPAVTVDALEHRIPNRLSLSLAAATLVLLGGASFCAEVPAQWGRALAAGASWSGLLALSFLIAGQPGPGDVKLAMSLGMILGWFGWNAATGGVILSYLLAAVVSGIGVATKRLGLRDGRVPMGPPMLVATIIVATGSVLT